MSKSFHYDPDEDSDYEDQATRKELKKAAKMRAKMKMEDREYENEPYYPQRGLQKNFRS